MSNHQKQTTEEHELFGDNTVSTAAQLVGRLPNGWELVSLKFAKEYGVGSWKAVVRGPRIDAREDHP